MLVLVQDDREDLLVDLLVKFLATGFLSAARAGVFFLTSAGGGRQAVFLFLSGAALEGFLTTDTGLFVESASFSFLIGVGAWLVMFFSTAAGLIKAP